MNNPKRIILLVILVAALLMCIGYSTLSATISNTRESKTANSDDFKVVFAGEKTGTVSANTTTVSVKENVIVVNATFTGTTRAEVAQDLKVYYTENVMKEETETVDENRYPNQMEGENDYLNGYYARAEQELNKLTLEEKIAQMYIIGGPKSHFNNLAKYKFGGYLFFADFFSDKDINTVSNEIMGYQTAVKDAGGLPLLTSIDEEGYKVSRLRASGFLAANGYSDFLNSRDLYCINADGIPNWIPIEEDIWNKSELLEKLSINLNFAPDIDMADPTSYIYERTLGQNAEITGEYASRVIMASKNTNVSYTLKHFPGYGNSGDTHNGFEIDTRTRAEFDEKDLIPFKRGIASGAECIMVSHNLVTCMDDTYPSSISANVHNVLRNDLGYTNIIITDAINMGAIHKTYTSRDAIIYAINAGNDMICISLDGSQKDEVAGADGSYDTLTYDKLISYVVDAVNNGEVSEDTINLAVRRIIAWKMYKGLL